MTWNGSSITSSTEKPDRVLVTGASGFVGRHLMPVLVANGFTVRALSRRPELAATRWPRFEWVGGDVRDSSTIVPALGGCRAAFYFVHSIGTGPDYRRTELEAAESFAAAADTAGVDRVVYLGGIAPAGNPSEHLRSRQEVGERLRGGRVQVIELRASMIVGHGSLSWLVVRDLAARLPVMILPGWLRSRTQPLAVDDVVHGLRRALDVRSDGHAVYDLPGPEALSGKEIIERAAAAIGVSKPVTVAVPFLSPRLSSLWLRLVTRADYEVAREIVIGLESDVLASDDRYWTAIEGPQRLDFEQAARRALAEERSTPVTNGIWSMVERARLPATRQVEPR